MKKLVPYLDVMFLFVSQTSTFDFLNSLYLKIFGFIRYTILSVSEIRIRSVFYKEKGSFSSILNLIKKTITTYTMIYHHKWQ